MQLTDHELAILTGILLLPALAYVSGIGYTLVNAVNPLLAMRNPMWIFGGGMVMTVATVVAVEPAWLLDVKLLAGWRAVLLAPLVCALVVGGEYLMNQVIHFFSVGKWTFRTTVGDTYPGSSRLPSVVAVTVALVVAEEFLVRRVAFDFLLTDVGLSATSAIVATAVVYASNHLTFGPSALLTKLYAGLVYSLFYHLSDYALVPVVVAHSLQNLGLLAASRVFKAPTTDFAEVAPFGSSAYAE